MKVWNKKIIKFFCYLSINNFIARSCYISRIICLQMEYAYYSEPYDLTRPNYYTSSPTYISEQIPNKIRSYSPVKTIIEFDKPIITDEKFFQKPAASQFYKEYLYKIPENSVDYTVFHNNVKPMMKEESPKKNFHLDSPSKTYEEFTYEKNESISPVKIYTLEKKCDDLYGDLQKLKSSLKIRVELEQHLQERNKELENEIFDLKNSGFSPIRTISYISEPEKIEKTKQAKFKNEEVDKLKTEIKILREELEKERNQKPTFNNELQELYYLLCTIGEDYKENFEKSKEIEKKLQKYKEDRKNRKIQRIQELNLINQRLFNVLNPIK